MALRISKREREEISKLNIRAKRKANRLYKVYGLKQTFKVQPIDSFKTRKEFNIYKSNINKFLLRTTHHYFRGGTYLQTHRESDYGRTFYVPIPVEKDKYARKLINQYNRRVDKIREQFNKIDKNTPSGKLPQTLGASLKNRANPNEFGLGNRYGGYYHINYNRKKLGNIHSIDKLIRAMERFNSEESMSKKKQIAHENYMQALVNVFGSKALPAINILENLTDEEFIGFFESNDYIQFDYIYDENLANSTIRNIYKHLLDYVIQQDIYMNKETLIEGAKIINESDTELLSEYNIGSLGGQRIKLNTYNATNETMSTSYIDLTPEEYEEYLKSYDITKIPNYEGRIKHYRTRKVSIPEKNMNKWKWIK